MRNWFVQVAIAIDQLGNALAGGYADETISSRAWRRHLEGRPLSARIINALIFWQRDHCLIAFQLEQLRKQLPVELRA